MLDDRSQGAPAAPSSSPGLAKAGGNAADALAERLLLHHTWLVSGGSRGTRFVEIGGSWVGASLEGADLRNADLAQTDFGSANLSAANLEGANLGGTIFHDANLHDAKLERAADLSRRNLAGADLGEAKLPPDMKDFPLVETAKEISDQAQKLTLLIVAACFYCWLTIGATTDASLVLNTGIAKLPVAGVDIPTASFYVVAPVVLVALHIYLHLNLQRLWECLAWLPSVFPDGQRLDRRAFSWLLADVVRNNLPRLRPQEVAFGQFGQGLSKLMIWWLIPLTLASLFQRNMVSQHAGSLTVQICSLAGVIVLTWRFRRVMHQTLTRRAPASRGRLRRLLRFVSMVGITVVLAACMGGWTLLAYSSLDTNEMSAEYQGPEGVVIETSTMGTIASHKSLARFAASSLAFAQNRLRADLSNTRLTTTPETWKGEASEDFKRIQGPDLKNRSLLGLRAKNSFLVKTDFSGSEMGGADLSGSDLRMMKYGLYSEDVEGWGVILDARTVALGYRATTAFVLGSIGNANFSRADLRFAKLWVRSLENSEFFGSDLRSASVSTDISNGPRSFIAADLRGAVMRGEGWANTLFYGARLEGADLSAVSGVTPQNFAFVMMDDKTKLPSGLPRPSTIAAPLTDYQAAMLMFATRSCTDPGSGIASASRPKLPPKGCLALAEEALASQK